MWWCNRETEYTYVYVYIYRYVWGWMVVDQFSSRGAVFTIPSKKGGDYEKAINPTNHGSVKITKCLFILLAR